MMMSIKNSSFRMGPLLALARNSLLEARHNKVLHIAGGFAAVLIVFSLFMGEVSLYQNEKIVKDVGLACISILGVFVAIFTGVTSLYQELEKRTIYTIVSKPISREQILLGKFLGMALVLFFVMFGMTVYFYLITTLMESKIDFDLLPALGLIYFELLIVAAIAVLFSSFSTPFLSGFFTFGIFLIGRVANVLANFGDRSRNVFFKYFAKAIQGTFDLQAFDLRAKAVHKVPIYAEDFWLPVGYAVCLISILLFISILFFRKRDFK